MAITTINSTDSGATSRTVINDNFTDLDTTKADLASPTFTGTPILPTGTIAVTQSASDNSTKVATTAYVDNQVTLGGASCLTSIPIPAVPFTSVDTPKTIDSETTGYLYQFILPFSITVNKISIKTGNSVATAGTYDLTIYSEDGQTKKIAVTTGTINATQTIYTTAVGAVALTAGMYWFMINPNGTAEANFHVYTDLAGPAFANNTNNIGTDVSSEPILKGTITIVDSTPPATISPTGITEALLADCAVVFRLDN